jgi:hypothetical protein
MTIVSYKRGIHAEELEAAEFNVGLNIPVQAVIAL